MKKEALEKEKSVKRLMFGTKWSHRLWKFKKILLSLPTLAIPDELFQFVVHVSSDIDMFFFCVNKIRFWKISRPWNYTDVYC